jgi:hypothetical protein
MPPLEPPPPIPPPPQFAPQFIPPLPLPIPLPCGRVPPPIPRATTTPWRPKAFDAEASQDIESGAAAVVGAAPAAYEIALNAMIASSWRIGDPFEKGCNFD